MIAGSLLGFRLLTIDAEPSKRSLTDFSEIDLRIPLLSFTGDVCWVAMAVFSMRLLLRGWSGGAARANDYTLAWCWCEVTLNFFVVSLTG